MSSIKHAISQVPTWLYAEKLLPAVVPDDVIRRLASVRSVSELSRDSARCCMRAAPTTTAWGTSALTSVVAHFLRWVRWLTPATVVARSSSARIASGTGDVPSVDRNWVVGGDRVRAGGSPHGQPGAPREQYFEGMTQLHTVTDEERREWFIKNDNFIID